jgi:hypothetical protein
LSKKIAMYGACQSKIRVKQRFWKKRRDGIRQRYWKLTKREKTVERECRYEFHGKGKALFRAVKEAHHIVPKGYVDVSAEEFLKNPEKYGSEGKWIEKKIRS